MNTTITIVKDNNEEVEMEILFTFEHDGNDIILYYDPNDEEGNTYASFYYEDGTLEEISDPEILEAVEERFNLFIEESDEDEED